MSEPVTAYLTKYACSTGKIEQIEVWDDGDGWAARRVSYAHFKWGRDIFRTRDEAVANAILRRLKKVVSLQKQIDKLEALDF